MSMPKLRYLALIASEAQRTFDFYTRTLGLPCLKQTVDFADPSSRRFYVGGSGLLLSFLVWPRAPHGDSTPTLGLRVANRTALLKWKRRFADHGVAVEGPHDTPPLAWIRVRDPDGVEIMLIAAQLHASPSDIATALSAAQHAQACEAHSAETWHAPVAAISDDMALDGFYSLSLRSSDLPRTGAWLHDALGLERVASGDSDERATYWRTGGDFDAAPLLVVTVCHAGHSAPAQIGAGQTHHIAFAVPDETTLTAWRERWLQAGLQVSPVVDQVYFKSVYASDPDGNLVELATEGPGFTVDEAPATLGRALRLPPWLEAERACIEAVLKPLRSA